MGAPRHTEDDVVAKGPKEEATEEEERRGGLKFMVVPRKGDGRTPSTLLPARLLSEEGDSGSWLLQGG